MRYFAASWLACAFLFALSVEGASYYYYAAAGIPVSVIYQDRGLWYEAYTVFEAGHGGALVEVGVRYWYGGNQNWYTYVDQFDTFGGLEVYLPSEQLTYPVPFSTGGDYLGSNLLYYYQRYGNYYFYILRYYGFEDIYVSYGGQEITPPLGINLYQIGYYDFYEHGAEVSMDNLSVETYFAQFYEGVWGKATFFRNTGTETLNFFVRGDTPYMNLGCDNLCVFFPDGNSVIIADAALTDPTLAFAWGSSDSKVDIVHQYYQYYDTLYLSYDLTLRPGQTAGILFFGFSCPRTYLEVCQDYSEIMQSETLLNSNGFLDWLTPQQLGQIVNYDFSDFITPSPSPTVTRTPQVSPSSSNAPSITPSRTQTVSRSREAIYVYGDSSSSSETTAISFALLVSIVLAAIL